MCCCSCCLTSALQVLYPTVAEHFGSAAADKLVEEHQELKNTLYELDGITDPNSPRLDELVQKTIRVGCSFRSRSLQLICRIHLHTNCPQQVQKALGYTV